MTINQVKHAERTESAPERMGMAVGGFQEGARINGWSGGGEESVWGKGQGV